MVILSKIGTLERIRRYPVKSMMGEDLARAEVSQSGIIGDRVYAFVMENAPNERFPWMTAREANEMLLFKPRFLEDHLSVSVTAPDGREFSISDEGLESYFERKYNRALLLRFDESGCKDSKPVSLISLQTVKALSHETAIDLDPLRFRANFYASWDSGKPFYEDQLVGKTLKIGQTVELKVVKKDSRCVITTLDPNSSKASPQVLETIKTNHAGCVGIYATIKTQGKISQGDPISVSG